STVGIRASCHTHHAFCEIHACSKFRWNGIWSISKTPCTFVTFYCIWISTLYYKSRHYSMKYSSIIETRVCKVDKVCYCLWCYIVKEFEFYLSEFCINHCNASTVACSGSSRLDRSCSGIIFLWCNRWCYYCSNLVIWIDLVNQHSREYTRISPVQTGRC